MVVIGVSTEKLAVLRILGANTGGVEASRATRTGRTHPATATMLAVRSSIVIGVLVFTILFGAVAVGHTHLLAKVLGLCLLLTIYIKTPQKSTKTRTETRMSFCPNFILKKFSFLLLQNMVPSFVLRIRSGLRTGKRAELSSALPTPASPSLTWLRRSFSEASVFLRVL